MSIVTISTRDDLSVAPTPSASDHKPLSVCIAGQSGAGKSTVLGAITEVVADRRENVVVLDEKALHHSYIDQLFVEPNRYAFELQLHFMVNRVLFVKRWLASGYSVVMERSHMEDPVFIRHLRAFNHVTQDEYNAYMSVWFSLTSRVPKPDLLIFLDVPVEVSVERLARTRSDLERPPFPDEVARHSWIASWHRFYRERFDELRTDPQGLQILWLGYPVNTRDLRARVARCLDAPRQ